MHTLALSLEEPQTILLQNCNKDIIFTLESISKEKNTITMTVLNVTSKNVRVISRDQAKDQIQKAINDIKRGVVKI
jgi:hypothetical protein